MVQRDRKSVLLEVLHGNKSWRVLQQYGFPVSFYDGRWEFGVDPEPSLRVSPADIAEGLIGLSSNSGKLREWASFVLAASSLLDLEDVEMYDPLLEALWDASFGDKVKSQALDLAKSLRQK